ncbi:hypothetical protein LR393_19860, partial [Kineosporia mesophila]|uniref:hypothetical protein n=1 Tax=Kineosporia mesophila TaxID=566012 RepID=UPI001E5B1FA1
PRKPFVIMQNLPRVLELRMAELQNAEQWKHLPAKAGDWPDHRKKTPATHARTETPLKTPS